MDRDRGRTTSRLSAPGLLLRVAGAGVPRPGAPEAPPLLSGVSLEVVAGDRLGLVGRSGAGKSTLLALLAGTTAPAEGSVVRAPGVRVAHLPQSSARPANLTVIEVASAAMLEVRAAEARMRDAEARLSRGLPGAAADHAHAMEEHERLGGYAAESELREVLHALGFPASSWEAPVAQLSAGQLRRLALATVLAAPADVLLLDEPTNHLDIGGRVWLEEYLVRRARTCVVVSHDRALLSAATTETLFLEAGDLRRVSGGYERAAKLWTAANASRLQRAAQARREAERLERVAAELARHGKRARARERRAGSLAARAAELAAATDRVAHPRLARPATLDGGRRSRGWLLDAEGLTRDGILAGVAARVASGDRIALFGPNGSGKSTLLSLLAGTLRPEDPQARLEYAPGMRLAYVGQEDRGLEQGLPVLEQLAAPLGEQRARAVLADAGLPYSSWRLPPERLSGGERAKAGLALALALQPDLLLLDEPDNDLDLQGVEALELALLQAAESGTALLVATHDRRLATSVLQRAWEVRDGELVAFPSVRAYLRGEEPLPASRYWLDAADGPVPVEEAVVAKRDLVEELEDERERLLTYLDDAPAPTDRERARARRRLSQVEGELIALLDAELAPPAPRYRFREGGLDVYADSRDHGRWRLVVADEPEAAGSELTAEEPKLPSAELRLVGPVAHLSVVEPRDVCYLPHAVGALLDGGVRLAFTVAGATNVQAFLPVAGLTSLLSPGADGWWYAELTGFLAREGWLSPPGAGPDRATSAGRGRGDAMTRERHDTRENGGPG